MHDKFNRKSGQAIIFLMVAVVIGLFVVIWNFDLHRVITAKIRAGNACDAAALAGARWQGVTLNMIGDLNLIQAAILSEEYERQIIEENKQIFEIPVDVPDLHDLRNRLAFLGPLAGFELAQQAAFRNGAARDPQVEGDILWIASVFRAHKGDGGQPYDNAFLDCAELLETMAANGAAVGSYTMNLPKHPLTDERFYSAIAQAMAGWWCPMDDYEYQLKHYETYEDWTTLRLRLSIYYIMNLKLDEFVSVSAYQPAATKIYAPATAIPDSDEYLTELNDYFVADERGIMGNGFPELAVDAMYFRPPDQSITWHVFSPSWDRRWPKPVAGKNDYEEDDADMDRFPLRDPIQPWFDYMGAEAGVSISTPVHRGILASSGQQTVNVLHKAKAKPFGYVDASGDLWPPYYYGFVFPVFQDVRLVHSDIGDKMLNADFFRHVMSHLGAYLASGPPALNPDCRYCRLLKAWEDLDKKKGLKWLEDNKHKNDNPCDPDEDGFWNDARGGATGGS